MFSKNGLRVWSIIYIFAATVFLILYFSRRGYNYLKSYPRHGLFVTQEIAMKARSSAILRSLERFKVEDVLSDVGRNPVKMMKLTQVLFGDNTLDSVTTFEFEFNIFTNKFSVWNLAHDDNLSLFFRKYEHIDNLRIIRRHDSSVPTGGHLLAPITMQHYLVSINSNGSNTNTMNLGLYFPYLINSHQALGLIDNKSKIRTKFNKVHTNSWDFLDQLLETDLKFGEALYCFKQYKPWVNLPHNVSSPYPFNELWLRLKEQPALVSEFVLWDDFKNLTKWSYSEEPADYHIPKWKGWTTYHADRHSMVMIGARKSSTDNQYYFLLQNTWKGKYFVEVSGDYLAWCEAKITFVTDRRISTIHKVSQAQCSS